MQSLQTKFTLCLRGHILTASPLLRRPVAPPPFPGRVVAPPLPPPLMGRVVAPPLPLMGRVVATGTVDDEGRLVFTGCRETARWCSCLRKEVGGGSVGGATGCGRFAAGGLLLVVVVVVPPMWVEPAEEPHPLD